MKSTKKGIKDSKSGDEFKEIFLKSPIGIILFGRDANISNANESALKMLGTPKLEDIIGRNIFDFVPIAEKKDKLLKEGLIKFQAPLDLKWLKDFDYYHPTKEGVLFLDFTVSVIDSGFLVQIQDITERKKTEEALKDSENRLKNIIHGSPVLTFVIDRDHKVLYWNKAIEEYSGVTAEEVVGTKNHWKGFYEEKRPLLADLVMEEKFEEIPIWYPSYNAKSKIVKGAYEIEAYFPTICASPAIGKKGRWLRATASAINDPEGISGAVEILEDITERKKAEEELKKAYRYNRGLIEASVDPLVTIGPDGKITDVNMSTESITGYFRDELIGTDFSDYFTEPEKARKGYQQVFREGIVIDYPLEIKHKNGHKTPVLYNASVYKDESGEVIGVFAAARDITERKKAEEKIERHERLLNGINMVLRGSLTLETEEAVAGKCLEVAEELTGSEFGFLSEINPEGRMDALAFSPSAWESFKIPPDMANRMLTNMEIASYWGRTIKEEKSQIVNKPESDPDRREFPEEHPKINSFLGVPLKKGIETIGMIGLANKKEDYTTKDAENIETLSVAFVEALMRKRAEIELKESYDILEKKVKERTVELEEAYGALSESEKRYRSTFENSRDAINVFSKDKRILDVNKQLIQLSGYSREELLSMKLEDLYPETAGFQTEERIKKMQKNMEIPIFEANLKTKHDQSIPVEIGVTPLKRSYGEDTVFLSNIRDITERKHVEKQLKEHVSQLDIYSKVITAANSSEDLQDLSKRVLHLFFDLMDFQGGGIYLIDKKEQIAKIVYSEGLSEDFVRTVGNIDITLPRYSKVLINGNSLFMDKIDISKSGVDHLSKYSLIVAVPIYSKDKIIGSFNLASNKRDSIDDNEKKHFKVDREGNRNYNYQIKL